MKTTIAALAIAAFALPALAQTQAIPNQGPIEQTAAKLVTTPKISLEGKFSLTSESPNSVHYLRWPVEKKGDVVVAYTLEILEDGEKLENGKTMVEVASAYAFACSKNTVRALGSGGYDIKGDLIDKAPPHPDTVSFKSTTIVADIAKAACGAMPKADEMVDDREEAEFEAEDYFDFRMLDELEEHFENKKDADKK